jgi:predicted secreted Zn-dependent protease
VDYETATLQVDSTCLGWSLSFEPLDDANVPYTLEDRFYQVHGTAFSELVPQMSHVKDKWAAFARWQTDWHFELLDSGSSCDLTSGSAGVDATITYPRWHPPVDADPAGVARWGRLMESLATHELGHITIALQGAHAIDDALDAGVSAATCPEVERLANAAASRLHRRYNRLNRRYDFLHPGQVPLSQVAVGLSLLGPVLVGVAARLHELLELAAESRALSRSCWRHSASASNRPRGNSRRRSLLARSWARSGSRAAHASRRRSRPASPP